jgi:hypothetical protein
MEKDEQRFVVNSFSLKGWASKNIHPELVSTLGHDAYRLSQIKIWLQIFRTGDLSCGGHPRVGRPPFALGPQSEAFLHKYPFASICIIAKHSLMTALTVKEILRRELGMRKFSRHWVIYSLSDAQKVARVDRAREMLMILQESETNDFNSIPTGDESCFQYITASSKMFARSAADAIPRLR